MPVFSQVINICRSLGLSGQGVAHHLSPLVLMTLPAVPYFAHDLLLLSSFPLLWDQWLVAFTTSLTSFWLLCWILAVIGWKRHQGKLDILLNKILYLPVINREIMRMFLWSFEKKTKKTRAHSGYIDTDSKSQSTNLIRNVIKYLYVYIKYKHIQKSVSWYC